MRVFESLDWSKIAELIQSSRGRVLYAAAGLDDSVAAALIEAEGRLGPSSVAIILDFDPDSFRLGYGAFEAATMLREWGLTVRTHSGLRPGLLVCDDQAWSFTMPPLLVEKLGSESINAIRLVGAAADTAYMAVQQSATVSNPRSEPEIGAAKLDDSVESETKLALEADPPQRFDLSRKVRVFNSKVEFVELEVHGCQIHRRRVRLPNELVLSVEDRDARDRIRAAYRVIEDASLSGAKEIERRVAELRKAYLRSIPGYGSLILRSVRGRFEEEIAALKTRVEEFRLEIADELGRRLATSISTLTDAFLPNVLRAIPKQLAGQVSMVNEANARRWIAQQLEKEFPTVDELVDRMWLVCIFKGVTYEVLADQQFQQSIKQLFPHEDWAIPLTEFDAAPGDPAHSYEVSNRVV